MIKHALQFLVVLIVAFVSALYGFSYFGDKIYEDKNTMLIGFGGTRDTQLIVMNALKNIELAEKNDFTELYKYNCQTLALFTNHLRPDDFQKLPAVRKEILNTKEKAIITEKRLRENGSCYE